MPFFIAMKNDNLDRVKIVQDLFNANGSQHYGEGVTQTQHAVQSYLLAKQAGANLELRLAAFVHDIGHLLEPEDDQGVDLSHEDSGAEWLKNNNFGRRISDLVASHVWAKRYLACDENYFNLLSEASKRSLKMQGGPLSEEERSHYERVDYFEDALNLRRWDDLAKDQTNLLSHNIPTDVWNDINQLQKFDSTALNGQF
jgi:putative nucleotidyltransferase with HDIG domain